MPAHEARRMLQSFDVQPLMFFYLGDVQIYHAVTDGRNVHAHLDE
jgi:hypothetical protein